MTSHDYNTKKDYISDRYELAENKIKNVIAITTGEDQKDLCDALEILDELRWIAMTNLKIHYELR